MSREGRICRAFCKGCTHLLPPHQDGFVVIKLTAKSLLFSGFSVTAYVLNHDYGANFVVMSEVIHSDTDL